MSLEDDYFKDDEADQQEESAEAEGSLPDGAAVRGEGASAPIGFRDWLAGRRGWLILVAMTMAQAIFASIVISLRSRARPMALSSVEMVNDMAVDMLGREIMISRISQVMPIQGGRKMVVFMDLALVLGELPEERVDGAQRPTPEEMALFSEAVTNMEPGIRSRVISLVRRIPPERYATGEAHREIADDVREYANGILAGLDFGDRVRPEVGRRRVTEVLLPAFIRQYS